MSRNIPEIDFDNPDFITAIDMINNTNRSIFLTGKAGSGKSTLLRYICETTRKKFIILAPTGIAAVNVGGMTMHSFFKMPLKPLLPDDPDYAPRKIRDTLKYTREKVKIIKNLDLIIIDEISMVRADMIDFMDRVLRYYSGNNREPFGGKQLLLVGDIFQLEPVIKSDFREILRRYYNNLFFFGAVAFSKIGLVAIELRKTYRQKDAGFISLLDRVRENKATADDLNKINSRYNRSGDTGDGNFVMTLATRRDTVDYINEQKLDELPTEKHNFEGEIEGTWPESILPTALNLTLKEGAQVVFIRNDKEHRWYNGTIARVAGICNDEITVELEDGNHYVLDRDQWENVQYEYDDKEKRIKETVLGVFKQYPVKLAWAMTIHKSQGLTFNRVVIDMEGGAFSCGQTYVALSRCTSLEGITLKNPITFRDIFVNPVEIKFSKRFNDMNAISDAKREFRVRNLLAASNRAFDAHDYKLCVDSFAEAVDLSGRFGDDTLRRFVRRKLGVYLSLKKLVDEKQQEIDRKDAVLRNLALEYVFLGNESVSSLGEGSCDREIALNSAIANFDKAMSIYPDCADAKMGKAALLADMGRTAEAEALYKNVLKTDRRNGDANYRMGLLSIGKNKLAEALKYMRAALKSMPESASVHESLADIYERIGIDDKAEQHKELARKYRRKK